MDTMNGPSQPPRIPFPRTITDIDDPYVFSPNFEKQALPKQFVESMKTLFNILDDSKTGYVSLTDIERRWRNDAVPNLPGFLESLRAVAPPDGFLSFNYFVTGLKLALYRARQVKAAAKQYPVFSSSSSADYVDFHPLDYNGHVPPTAHRGDLPSSTQNQYRVSPSYAQFRLNGNGNDAGYPTTATDRYPSSHQQQQVGNTAAHDNNKQHQHTYVNMPTTTEADPITHKQNNTITRRGTINGNVPANTAMVRPRINPAGVENGNLPSKNKSAPKFAKMGYATKFTKDDDSNPQSKNSTDKEANGLKTTEIKADDAMVKKPKENCIENGVITKLDLYEIENASTSSGSGDSTTRHLTLENAKSVDLAGKYIALAGISRKKKKAIVFPSGKSCKDETHQQSENENGSSKSSSSKFRNFHRRWKKSTADLQLQYQSAGESGDESHKRKFKKSQSSSTIGDHSTGTTGVTASSKDGDSCTESSVPHFATLERSRPKRNRRADNNRRHTVGVGAERKVIQRLMQLQKQDDILAQSWSTLNEGRLYLEDCLRTINIKRQEITSNQDTSDDVHSMDHLDLDVLKGLASKLVDVGSIIQTMADGNTPIRDKPFETDFYNRKIMEKIEKEKLLYDITQKEERISRLEHEKLELVKQLFQVKAEYEKEKIGGKPLNASIFI